MSGRMVVQPSASFIEELNSSQSVPGQQPTLKSVTQAIPPAEVPPILPSFAPQEATTSTAGNPEQAQEPSPIDQNASSKITVVRVLASVIVLLDVINAYTWYISHQVGLWHWVRILEIIASLVLAIGIFRLSEAARSFYVSLAFLLVTLSVVGMIISYLSLGNTPVARHTLTKTEIEHSIEVAEKNPSLTPRDRQLALQKFNDELSSLSDSSLERNFKPFLTDGLALLVAIGPLILLTRAPIKQVFK